MGFIWDNINIAHTARHGITPELAERIVQEGMSSIKRSLVERRYAVEATIGDKHYRLIFEVLEDNISIYPVTAYPIRKRKF